MRTPSEEENDTYNKLLEGIESADTDSPRWDEVRDALKMLWSLAGGVVTETENERRCRLDKEAQAIEVSNTPVMATVEMAGWFIRPTVIPF